MTRRPQGPEDAPEHARDLDAAERALGTQRGAENAVDAQLRRRWEDRLLPLIDDLPAEAPPAALADAIMMDVDGWEEARAEAEERRTGRRAAGFWRATGMAATALAAVLLFVVVTQRPAEAPAPAQPRIFMARVAAGPTNPAMVVTIDLTAGVAAVMPLTAPPPGASYEMWRVPDGGTPVSLGLLPDGAAPLPRQGFAPGDLIAVSLEPEGGTPTGSPSQVVFTGLLQPVDVPADGAGGDAGAAPAE